MGKWRLWVSFQPFKTEERKDKVIWTCVFLMSRSLFFHQTTEPLALASSAVFDGFILARRLLPVRNGQALQSHRVWLQGAVDFGESSVRPGCLHFYATCRGLLHFPPPVTSQHCLLSSWCSWAKLEFQIQNWHFLLKEYSYCLSSSLVWFFHVPWRLSHANVNTLPFVFHFKVSEKNLGWQWYVKKILTESHKILRTKGFRTSIVNEEEFHLCYSCQVLDVPVVAK